jgi:hypothetical protein
MGILSEKRAAKLGEHTIEVLAKNHVWRGLTYTLFFDGVEVASARNFWKIPTRRTLEARVIVDGTERHIVVAVRQHWLWCEFILTVDGEALALALNA